VVEHLSSKCEVLDSIPTVSKYMHKHMHIHIHVHIHVHMHIHSFMTYRDVNVCSKFENRNMYNLYQDGYPIYNGEYCDKKQVRIHLRIIGKHIKESSFLDKW
jgi:hypothetical protein